MLNSDSGELADVGRMPSCVTIENSMLMVLSHSPRRCLERACLDLHSSKLKNILPCSSCKVVSSALKDLPPTALIQASMLRFAGVGRGEKMLERLITCNAQHDVQKNVNDCNGGRSHVQHRVATVQILAHIKEFSPSDGTAALIIFAGRGALKEGLGLARLSIIHKAMQKWVNITGACHVNDER